MYTPTNKLDLTLENIKYKTKLKDITIYPPYKILSLEFLNLACC